MKDVSFLLSASLSVSRHLPVTRPVLMLLHTSTGTSKDKFNGMGTSVRGVNPLALEMPVNCQVSIPP